MITPDEVRAKTPERFWTKIKFGEPDECWEWQRAIGNHGYGRFDTDSNDPFTCSTAHRFLYKSLFGNISDKILVCHSCDNKICCNPNHLFAGTHLDNVRDMDRKGRRKSGYVKGSRHGMSKLTEDDVVEIKIYLANNERHWEIGQLFNVGRTAISAINGSANWGHIK